MSLKNWLLLIVLALLWGGSFFLNGVAVKELPVLSIVFSRVFIAALILMLFMRVKNISIPLTKSMLGAFLFMGFVNNVIPFSLIVAGQAHIGSGLASILNATTPLFTAVIAHISTNEPAERLGPRRVAGIICGIAGVAVLLAPQIGDIGFTGEEVFGQIAVLGAALSYGIAVVFGRRFAKNGVQPIAAATGQVSASSLLLFPFVLVIDTPWTFIGSVSLTSAASLFSLAFFCTAIAYILYFQLIKSAGATNASLVTLLVPVSAVVLGILFLGETLSDTMLYGMACIGFGLVIIDGRILKLFQKNSPA